MLRANSPLRSLLGTGGTVFLENSAAAIERILPHIQVSGWTEGPWAKPGSVWVSSRRTSIRVTIAIGRNGEGSARSLIAEVSRRALPGLGKLHGATLDSREHDICGRIALRISEVLRIQETTSTEASIRAIGEAFDEYVIANHIESFHDLSDLPVGPLFDALHKLSEQSYENKSISFGCIVECDNLAGGSHCVFPDDFLRTKKYKALSDGFRTAYRVSGDGKVLGFVDLEDLDHSGDSAKHFYPDWTEPIARASRGPRLGIALSRQGDILVFDAGTLRFTYRYGQWQYWNHAHLVKLLRDRAAVQRVPKKALGRVVGAIYRAALDVSFRRSGGLFVVLRNSKNLRQVVRLGDAIGDDKRSDADAEFDQVVREQNIQNLRRAVLVELASLDGAIVLENSGKIRAYGAILQPKKAGLMRGAEGSRTKAAISASKYGLAVKVSSDGDVTVYHEGAEFIKV